MPGWDNDTFEIQNAEHQKLIDKFIPAPDKAGLANKYDQCKIKNFSSNINFTIVSCDKWVYSKEFFGDSMITEVSFLLKKVMFER